MFILGAASRLVRVESYELRPVAADSSIAVTHLYFARLWNQGEDNTLIQTRFYTVLNFINICKANMLLVTA